MTTKEMIETIKIPEGINFEVNGNTLTLKSGKGELKREFKSHRIKFEKKESALIVIGTPANRQTSALLNTIVAHTINMVKGLKFGFKYDLQISYSHFPMTAELKNKEIFIKNFLGEKFPRKAKVVGDTKVEIKGQDVKVSGHNLEEVSQTAANISQASKVRGRDIRRFTDGIYLVERGTIEKVPEDFKVEVIRGRE